MTENDLTAALKTGTFEPLYFFYGDEDYIKNHRTSEIRQAILADAPDFAAFNAIECAFGDGETDFGRILEAVQTPPMLASRKFVLASFASLDTLRKEQKKALLHVLQTCAEQTDGGTVLVLRVAAGGFDPGTPKRPSSFLAEASRFMACIPFEYQSDARLYRWLNRHAAEYGVHLPQDAAAQMLQTAGRSMFRLSGEIAKTAAYTAQAGRTAITPEDVALCVTRTEEDDAFGLANCILSGSATAALEALGVKMRRREDPVFLLAQITRVFDDLCCAAAFITDGQEKEFARATGMHSYKAGLYLRAARMREETYFLTASRLCAEADRALKTSAADGYTVIERLVCTLLS